MSVCEVDVQDLESLGTLHARAFHPRNESHRKLFPASTAPWWVERYADEIDDPTYTLLKIPHPESPNTVVGLISLRRYEANERGAGRWSSFPPPPGVDNQTFDAMVQSMAKYREEFMINHVHLCVDHFAVDGEYQGKGLGTQLLERACQVADKENLDMFVQANDRAESFYHRFGFETRNKLEMPGGLVECFLIRRSP